MSVAQAILLNAFIKKENGDLLEYKRLKKLVSTNDYDPIPGKKTEFYSRLYESLDSNFFDVVELNHHEKCQIHAEHYLLFIYGILLQSELSSSFELNTGNNLKQDMDKLLGIISKEVCAK